MFFVYYNSINNNYCNFTDFSIKTEEVDDVQRVEIYNNGKWGLVCSNGWDTHDATVVCQEKKLGTDGIAVQISYNKMETVWLSGVNCVGNESQLSFCPHNGIGIVDNCRFAAGVNCYSKTKVLNFRVCDVNKCNLASNIF